MDLDTRVRAAIYDHVVETTLPPSIQEVASTLDSLFASHGDVRGVWGWTITADRHKYQHPEDAWQFNLGLEHWIWIQREMLAAEIFFLEQTRSPLLRDAHAMLDREFGTRRIAKTGDARESLLREFEEDAAAVRAQYRRLGVTHAVIALADGNPPYDAVFDRGPSAGPNAWNMTAPDGTIDLFIDILGVILQHGHECSPTVTPTTTPAVTSTPTTTPTVAATPAVTTTPTATVTATPAVTTTPTATVTATPTVTTTP